VRQRLKEAETVQRDTICAGALGHKRYKLEAGKLMGLQEAMTILEKAVSDIMKG